MANPQEIPSDSPSQFSEESENILATLLGGYWTYVHPYLWMYITSVVLFLLCSLVYLYTATPLYRSSCRLHISRNQVNVVQVQGLTDPTFDSANAFLKTQVLLLQSGEVVGKGMERLGLSEEQRACLQWPEVTEVKGTNLVDVSVVSSDRELAAKSANAIAQAYIDSMHDRKTGLSSSGVELLQQQLGQVTREHETAVQELLEFKKSHKIYDFQANYGALTEQLEAIQDAILADEAKMGEILALREEIQSDREAAVTMLPYLLLSHDNEKGAVSSSNVIAEKLGRLQELSLTHQMSLPELTAKYGANAQAVQIHNKVDELLKSSLNEEIETGIRGLGLSATQIQKHMQQLQKRAEEINRRLAELDRISGEFHRRETSVASLAKTMEMLVTRIYEIQISDATDKLNDYAVFVTAPAFPASAPFTPVRLKVLAMGLILGVAAAAGLSFLLVSCNTRLTSLEPVATAFGSQRLPDFGTVPSVALDPKTEATLTEEQRKKNKKDQEALLLEAFQDIRTALNLSLVTRTSKVLALCSAVSGEGKTIVASWLARSFAQEGRKVLLMDCDLRKPDIHHVFQDYLPKEARKRGISNVLVGDCKLSEVIHHTSLGLDIATTGPVPDRKSVV